MKEETARRLSVTHQWAARHAKKSTVPSRFLDKYEVAMNVARQGTGDPDSLIDYRDPLQLAAEIEAFAAWRRVLQWDKVYEG